MRAMVLKQPGALLEPELRPDPVPDAGEIRIRIEACGVCRTDLHIVDGDLASARLPIVPGHEIVGRVEAAGPFVRGLPIGQRVGVPWIGRTCGHCAFCVNDRENLCDDPTFTGYSRDGGFASHAIADASFVIPLDGDADAVSLAPLLCAGLIGWRSLKIAGPGRVIGLYGFGAAAHILAQVCVKQGRRVHAFTRPGDLDAQRFALSLGAVWAGGSDQPAAEPLEAAIIFAPIGDLVPAALRAVRKGGRVVCAGIHMSDIPAFPYKLLWEERQLVSVANLTRADAREFFAIGAAAQVGATTRRYALEEANSALDDLRGGRIQGAAVLVP